MICSQCKQRNSPPNARFCVDCGYALLQPCPYACGHAALPVRAGNPVAQCPSCARFTVYCPSCFRLGTLGERSCPTRRCAIARVQMREPFAPHSGRAGGAPLGLHSPWQYARPHLLKPDVQVKATGQRCGGVASRYGQFVWWKEDKLFLWPAPVPGQYWSSEKLRTANAIHPLFRGGIFPHREALLLAHGNAYLLGDKIAMRVPLGATDESAQTLAMSARAEFNSTTDELGWENARPATSATATDWQAHQIEWLAQNETSTRWLGLGEVGGELVGVSARASGALFEGERWQLPAEITLNDWQDLLVWNDAPVLLCERTLWRENAGVWEKIFELPNSPSEFSLRGAMVAGTDLWFWGGERGRLWAKRRSADGVSARASMRFDADDRLDSMPVAAGTRITFFVAGARNGVATLDVLRPLDDSQFQQIPAASTVLWTGAARFERTGQSWLLYAIDDGELVKLQMIEQSPVPSPPLELARFAPFRDAYGASKGATLAATMSGDCLMVALFGTIRGEPNVRLLGFSWGELG